MNGSPDGEIEGTAPINVPNSAETSDGLPPLVGRIRRLHKNKEWGLIYSELPLSCASCDIFLDAAEAEDISSLEQGDFVIFDFDEYEHSARNVRKAAPEEVDTQQARLAPFFENFRVDRARGSSASSNRVAELPSGGAPASMVDGTSSMMLARGDAMRDASSRDAAGHLAQSAVQNAALANAALAGASTRGHQLPIHHELSAPPAMLPPQLESPLQPPPPPQLPPPPAHPAPGGSGEAFNYLQTAQQAYGGYPPNYGQDMHGQMYHQGINHWPANETGSNQMNPMVGIAEHAEQAVKILEEPLPALENLNPKDMVNMLTGRGGSQRKGRKFTTRVNTFGMSLGREFAEILRQAADMHSQTEQDAQAQDQWANWHWWVTPQTQGDAQMSSNHVFHGAVQHGGHGVLATPGMTR